jgi:hypothetical protein
MSAASADIVPEWRRLWLYLLTGIIALFLITPVLIIVPM